MLGCDFRFFISAAAQGLLVLCAAVLPPFAPRHNRIKPARASMTSPIAIITSSLHGARVGSSCTAPLTAQGGKPPYSWSLASASLPAGLRRFGGGTITGTQTVAANSCLTIAAKDAAPPPRAASQSESIAAATSSQLAPPPQAAGYSLVFSDDFDTLNLSPNGYGDYAWYNPGIYFESAAPYSNVSVANSILTLLWTTGQSPANTSISTCAVDASYCKAWRYGYFEARMRWDDVRGAWPALWMMPVQYTTCDTCEIGELDIFEGAGGLATSNFLATIHDWYGEGGQTQNSQDYVLGSVDVGQYHTYGVLWVPGQVTWYFDDQPILTAPTYPIFDQQNYYIILGSQEGIRGQYGNMKGVTASSIGMNVDWVRVWQP